MRDKKQEFPGDCKRKSRLPAGLRTSYHFCLTTALCRRLGQCTDRNVCSSWKNEVKAMGRDPKRRQQAAARKKARIAKRKKNRAHGGAPGWDHSVSRSEVRNAPIHTCLMTADLFKIGIGHVVIARKLPSGGIGAGIFMVDAHCLGVKGAFLALGSELRFDDSVRKMAENSAMRTIEPPYARKLIEQSVVYAESIGFQPDPDYDEAAVVFGDIDPNACTEEFTFGENGKPFYVSGPHDSPEKRAMILATLQAHCGEGNYDFQVTVGENPPPDSFGR
jgi:hypothetical protein